MLTNVPRISDVEVMARLLLDLGAEVEGIGQVVFTHKDVIRHDLVARIVAAYDPPSGTRPGGKIGEKTDGKASGQE